MQATAGKLFINRGATALSYSLLAGLIALAAAVVVTAAGAGLGGYSRIGVDMPSAGRSVV